MKNFQINRLSDIIGAEVRGIDLRKELDDETAAALLDTLFQHQRNPDLIYVHPRTDFPPEERRLLRRLTVEDEHPVLEGAPPYREAVTV